MNFKTYLQSHGRKLDLVLYEHLFEAAPAQHVLDELASYQNNDGGFGKALEPDLRLPDSSALATTIAFQYLVLLTDVPKDSTLVKRAIDYLTDSYITAKNGWVNIPPAANQHPRAPWWEYETANSSVEWGNPSAEILGCLLKYGDRLSDRALLEKLSEQALQRLHETTEPEQHEVKCYIRLYKYADKELQTKLYDRIAEHIKKLAKTDPKEWEGYAATPLTFVDSPDSPFAGLFDKQALIDNANFIKNKLVNNDHWEPMWEWGRFDKEWEQAKKDWSGKLTVDNLLLLQAFGIQLEA